MNLFLYLESIRLIVLHLIRKFILQLVKYKKEYINVLVVAHNGMALIIKLYKKGSAKFVFDRVSLFSYFINSFYMFNILN